MAGIRSLDLPASPRAAVFRAMETIVRGNSDLPADRETGELSHLAGIARRCDRLQHRLRAGHALDAR